MAGYCVHSFVWHFRKGYFHTGSKLTEAYIIGKILITLFTLNMCSFFVLKKSSDSIMFEYFNRKEDEWDKMVESKARENEYIKDYVANKDKNNAKIMKQEKKKDYNLFNNIFNLFNNILISLILGLILFYSFE